MVRGLVLDHLTANPTVVHLPKINPLKGMISTTHLQNNAVITHFNY